MKNKIMKHRPNAAPQYRRLKPIAAACTVLTLLAAGVQAQQVPAPGPVAEAAQLDTVVITGIRKSMETSLNMKRQGSGVVDGIVAEDIGKFPDTNLAESLQRIAGVSIERSANGEGRLITVRGVGPDFNLITLNGRQMPTGVINPLNGGASGSRAFDLANLSSDSISALEVYKTSRASFATGGIGATVNIRTARPLDSKERVLSLGIKGVVDNSDSRLPSELQGSSVTPEFSGIYSDTFASGTLGIAISGSYAKRDSGSNKAYTQNGWRTFTANSGDWGSIPPKPATGTDLIKNRPTSGLYGTSVDMRYSLTALERERTNGQVTLQYAPSKDLKFALDYTAATNTTRSKNAEYSSWFNFSFGPTTFNSLQPASPILQTAVFDGTHDIAINTGQFGETAQLQSTGFNTEWKVSDTLKVDMDYHHSTSVTKPNSPYGSYSVMGLGLFAQGNAIAHYDNKLPILELPGTKFDAKKLLQTGSQFVNNLAEQTVDQFQLGSIYKINDDNKLNLGLGFTKVHNRAASYNNQNNDWGGIGSQGDYAGVQTKTANLPSFFGQIPGSSDPRLTQNFYSADFNSLRSRAIEVLMASRPGTTRAQAEAYFSAAPNYALGNDWLTTEKSVSAYGQWDHPFEAAGVPMNISAGLRYESTEVESSSQVISRTGSSWISQNEISVTPGPTVFATQTGKYKYFLPSIDWDADVTSNFKVRASYGQNIGRPGWGVLAGGKNFDSNANAGGGLGSGGNPALKPLLSKNFDFSAEYYYAKSSYVAFTPFYKDVTNFVGTSSIKQTVPGLTTPIGGAYYTAGASACGANPQPLCIRNYIFNTFKGKPGVVQTGVNASGEILGTIAGLANDPLMNFQVGTPANEKGDIIKGLELNAQHMFGGSGFGVAGNLTWVKTGLKYDVNSTATQAALEGVSNSANLVGFYENYGWSIRAAYNWRDEFLASKGDGSGQSPVYTEAYGQFDMSIGYKFGKSLSFQADLINLNDGYIRQHGRNVDELQSVIQTGRRYQIGARYRF